MTPIQIATDIAERCLDGVQVTSAVRKLLVKEIAEKLIEQRQSGFDSGVGMTDLKSKLRELSHSLESYPNSMTEAEKGE